MSQTMRRCASCNVMCIGQLCQPCRWEAMRKPLSPCVGCKAPLHRRSTPEADRMPGSRLLDSHGRCGPCANVAVNDGTITRRPRDTSTPVVRVITFDPLPVATLTIDEKRDAVCAQTDPEAFFPEKGGSTREAKKVCSVCPLRAQQLGGNGRCLDVAIENGERFGIWGGLSERERRKVSDARRAAASETAA